MFKWLFGWMSKREEFEVVEDKWAIPSAVSPVKQSRVSSPLSGKIRVPLKWNGSYAFDILGESNYQDALAQISGRKSAEGKAFKCIAMISLEPENPHDSNAVVVKIDGSTVGYFSKIDAKDYSSQTKGIGASNTQSSIAAMIVGGFKNKTREGHYGVKLDITRHA